MTQLSWNRVNKCWSKDLSSDSIPCLEPFKQLTRDFIRMEHVSCSHYKVYWCQWAMMYDINALLNFAIYKFMRLLCVSHWFFTGVSYVTLLHQKAVHLKGIGWCHLVKNRLLLHTLESGIDVAPWIHIAAPPKKININQGISRSFLIFFPSFFF